MANYLDKMQLNTAITDSTKLDLGHQHITTADFMQLNVSNIMELVPGTKVNLKMETFARLNPLVVPTFGRASIRSRHFWVPFRSIYRGFNDFITDSVHVASSGYTPGSTGTLLQTVPTIDMDSLRDCFLNNVSSISGPSASTDGSAMIYQVVPNSTNSNWDFQYTNGGITYSYCYTVKGRQAIKTLEALGYKVDWSDWTSVPVFSCLPLLALAKIFTDWYFPQQYSNRVEYDLLLAMCNHDIQSGPFQMTDAMLNTLLSLCAYVQYDSDLFVSAWDQPNSPNAGNYSGNYKLVNIDSIGTYYGTSLTNVRAQGGVSNKTSNGVAGTVLDKYGDMDAPFLFPSVDIASSGTNASLITGGISEYLLHGLHALSDFLKRNQIAGSRAVDRYLARFGKSLPAEVLNRSKYLGADIQDVQIGDIMSTSDTANSKEGTGSNLGDFAGKGMAYGTGGIADFYTDEFGYLITLTSIVPATGYFQGIDPLVERRFRLDYFQPELENLGVETLKASNLYIPQISGIMTSGNAYEQIFGFVPRYATYKTSTCMDRLTGNFRIPSLNAGNFLNTANSWHLMRTFDGIEDFGRDYANVVHSPQFINGGADFSQYKRLFYYDDADGPDNFTIIHNFEIAEYAPMKPLYDSYEFEDKGKKITLETNGVKLN